MVLIVMSVRSVAICHAVIVAGPGSSTAPTATATQWMTHFCDDQSIRPANIAIDPASGYVYVVSAQGIEWSTIVTLTRGSSATSVLTGCCGGPTFGPAAAIHKLTPGTGVPLFSYGFAGDY